MLTPQRPRQTAGDIAFSMNHDRAYEELLAEGVRAEMLRAVIESASRGEEDDDGDGSSSAMAVDAAPESSASAQKLSTASDNATFLSSRLHFTTDSRGQAVALDAEGNGVMMNWEDGIMRRTVEAFAREGGWESRKGRQRGELVKEEDEGAREPLKVLNVGFGLGIASRCPPPPHPGVRRLTRADSAHRSTPTSSPTRPRPTSSSSRTWTSSPLPGKTAGSKSPA